MSDNQLTAKLMALDTLNRLMTCSTPRYGICDGRRQFTFDSKSRCAADQVNHYAKTISRNFELLEFVGQSNQNRLTWDLDDGISVSIANCDYWDNFVEISIPDDVLDGLVQEYPDTLWFFSKASPAHQREESGE